MTTRSHIAAALLLAAAAAPLHAQARAADARPAAPPLLADNSFLLEEAYNQEPRVVQHIFTFSHAASGRGWELAFEQEWPAPGMRHQLSYAIGFAHTEAGRDFRPGDLALNYRYQMLGMDEDARVAVAPRLSLVLPTGKENEGTGRGGVGYGAGIPISVELTPRVVTHTNVGVTFIPSLGDGPGEIGGKALDTEVGQSVIWFASPTLHLMLEGLWSRERTDYDVEGPNPNVVEKSFLLSPGLRKAFNLRSGTQLVPGIAFPIELTGDETKKPGLFLYFSVEHGF